MLSGMQLKKLSGNKFSTTFNASDVMKMFDSQGPMDGIVSAADFSLTWFIEQCFNTKDGKPLRLMPFQSVMLDMLWHKKFPMVLATRGAGKTFMLALYSLLRCILVPGTKVVICGAGYRQAKLVFRYIDELYQSSPILKEAMRAQGGPKYGSDAATLAVGGSSIMAIPIGDGEKIRGIRATVLIADEFASIPEEIFEIVISPFAAVHANPAERARMKKFQVRLEELGIDPGIIDKIEETKGFGNQVVISGTASHKQNHFYKRYQIYRMFIESKGDPKKLRHALEQSSMASTGQASEIDPEDITRMSKTWKQYAIYQLPYHALPQDFLDEDIIRSDRAKFPRHRFMMEYLAQFPDDTDGFIKRSLIESSTPRDTDIPVHIELYGDPRATYVMGLDPARFNDNFGCVVLKLSDRGKEFVYCNAWDATKFSISAGKIREVCSRFNIEYIAMDTGGGGASTVEWLFKKQENVQDRELIWPIPDQMEKYAGSKDGMSAPGKKIIEMVNFSPSWTSESAHNLLASIEHKNLLFPYKGDDQQVQTQYSRYYGESDLSDDIVEKLQRDLWGVDEWESKQDGEDGRLGIYQHIQECVNEVCAISRVVTPGGVEQFSLPKLSEQPEGLDMRRRDRFSALMLANYAAKVYLGHGHKSSNLPGVSTGGRRKTRTSRNVRKRGGTYY